MDSLEKIYSDLTGVNIEEQKILWDERGKGYYGEYQVLKELYYKIPGVCKILMNLNFPVQSGKTTEIDLLMIHETGLYVFEVKHYKGTIYGTTSEENWTQYFRTARNNSFRNPVNQNKYHISAVRKKYPDLPIYSFIVFTNPLCDLRIKGSEPDVSICYLHEIFGHLKKVIDKNSRILDMVRINEIFDEMSELSPLMKETIVFNGEVIPFCQFAELLKSDFQEEAKKIKADSQKEAKKNKLKVRKAKLFSIATCILFALIMVFASANVKKQAEEKVSAANKELATLAQKFEHIDEFNNGNLTFSDDLVLVSEVVLEQSSDILNAVNFSCKLTCVGENYGISVGEDVTLVVILKDGQVKEYDLWNETYSYSSDVRLGNTMFTREGKIGVHEFYDIKVSDISYIKLINLGVWSFNQYSRENIAEGYEIELYNIENN